MSVAVTMFKLLFAMALGVYLNRRGILTAETNRKLSSMILDITAPLLILTSVGAVTGGDRDSVYRMLLAGAVMYCLLPLLGWLAACVLRVRKGMRSVFMCAIMFSNNSFMGYPVVESLYGSEAIFYTTLFNFGFSLLFYTLAEHLIAKDAGETASFRLKQVLSPGMVTAVAAVIINLTGITLPDLILQPCSFVGSLTSPLSMLIIGANMAQYSLRDVFSGRQVYGITVLRLLAMPLITACFVQLFTDRASLVCIAAMSAGMPVASMVAMAGGRYEATAKISNVCVVLSTLCSMVTIPVIAAVFRLWFGV